MAHNKLTCLFGFHDYSKELTKDKQGNPIHLCKICKRSGYLKYYSDGFTFWRSYDEDGNLLHTKYSDGFETSYEYDAGGNCIHEKWSDGQEWRYKY